MKVNLFFDGLTIPVQAESMEKIKGGYLLHGKQVTLQHPLKIARFYRHGFHSWSLTSWLKIPSRLSPPTIRERWPFSDPPEMLESFPTTGSCLGAVEDNNGQVLLLGALTCEALVHLDENSLTGSYNIESGDEWFTAFGNELEVFKQYAELLRERMGQGRFETAPRVWCSWYGLYRDISEESLSAILDGVRGQPFDIFQVDDGWQIAVGDWEANEKFSCGMASLAGKIKQAGFKAGIWLAPFIASPQSQLFQDHPDWFVCDESGEAVPAGQNWGDNIYALDLTQTEVLDWLGKLIRMVRSWGYDYLKIDFLYAAAIAGQRALALNGETAYRQGLAVVRQAAGDAYLLVCGAPIMSSIGLADGIRVGTDVAPYWDNPGFSQYLNDFSYPSTLNAIRISLNRLWLKPLINIDPDVTFFRRRYNLMSDKERGFLRDLALICAFKATSDLPVWLDTDEKAELVRFLQDRRKVERLGRYLFRIGDHEVDFSFTDDL